MQFDLSQNWAVEFHCQLTWAVTSWLSAELPDARYSFNSARRYFIHDVKTRRTFELRMHVMYSAGHHRKLLRSSKLYLELTSLRDQASINSFKTLTLVKKITGRTPTGNCIYTDVRCVAWWMTGTMAFLNGMQKESVKFKKYLTRKDDVPPLKVEVEWSNT